MTSEKNIFRHTKININQIYSSVKINHNQIIYLFALLNKNLSRLYQYLYFCMHKILGHLLHVTYTEGLLNKTKYFFY